MKVALCTPSRDVVSAGYAKSLANLSVRLSKNNVDSEVLMVLGSVIPQLRTDIVNTALEKNCEWLLWLDSDMHFPSSTFERLMSHNKSVVAATYSTRYKPQRSVAFTDHKNYNSRLTARDGIHSVFAVGMGCMLTHRSVFETLPQPWFCHEWDPTTQSFLGEDIYFCKSLKMHGIDVHIDVDLSEEIGHYGTKIFLLQETTDYKI